MPAALYNHTRGARRIGGVTIAPGTAAVIHDDKWSKNRVIKEWIEQGDLQVVSIEEVDKINAGMDIKKAKAVKEAEEKQTNTPPPNK